MPETDYRPLYENCPDGFLRTDMKGKLIEANRSFLKMLGYSHAELVEKSLNDITPDHWHSEENTKIAEYVCKRGYTDIYEKEFIRKDNTVLPVEIRAFLHTNAHNTPVGIWYFIRVICGLKKLEAVLAEERQITDSIFRITGALIIILDSTGRIVRFNHACESTTGFVIDEIKGKKLWDILVPPKETEAVKNVFKNLVDGHFPNQFQNSWLTKTGEHRFIQWSNTVIPDADAGIKFIVGTGIDITEQHKMSQDLIASEKRYRTLLDNVSDGVAILENKTIRFFNETFIQFLKYSNPDSLMDQPLAKFVVNPEMAEQFFVSIETDIQNTVRLCFLTRDNQTIWLEIITGHIIHEKKPAYLITARDITETVEKENKAHQEANALIGENIRLRSSIKERFRFRNIIGKSKSMQTVYSQIIQAAATRANVIILGESGTGKDLVARAIHDLSDRGQQNFVPVNCGAIPETLIESEFFGHMKGAFTGAHITKGGFFQSANHGTLFLDEVGEVSLNMQVKLLRVIENGEYFPIGSTTSQQSDVRLIAATNRDLLQLVKSNKIREDFYYRISVIPITIPPLRERSDDIPLLLDHFLNMYAPTGYPVKIPGHMLETIFSYDWPGNIRELQSVIQRYLAIGTFDLAKPPESTPDNMPQLIDISQASPPLKAALEQFENHYIHQILEKNKWRKGVTAKVLDIDPKTLYLKLQKYGKD